MLRLFDDLRYGIRQLLSSPTFTTVTILTLALGVGANTAIFSVVQAILLHPVGVDDPGRVVSLHARYALLNLPSAGVSAPDFADAESLDTIVESAAMVQSNSVNATFAGRTQHMHVGAVTWKWFQAFGAQPILGRTFLPEEDQKGATQEAVLSYSVWQDLFGGREDAIGKPLALDGKPYRIVGVMGSDFEWPRNQQLWTPLGLESSVFADGNRFNEDYDGAIVRLRPGVSVARFNAALDQKRLEEIRREGTGSFALSSGWGVFGQPLAVDAAGDLRKPILALFAVAAIILLIACTNVSGLMLAKFSNRTRELKIRVALGASLSRIISQFVTEAALLSGVASFVAMASGPVFGKLLLLAMPYDLASGFIVKNNFGLGLAAAGFGVVACLLSSIGPVLLVARSHKGLRLSENAKGATACTARQRFRNVLVSIEVALAFLLVTGAGLFLSSLRQLEKVDPGFNSAGVVSGSVTLNASNYRDQPLKVANFLQAVTTRLSQQPSVIASAAVFPLPFGNGQNPSESFEIQTKPTLPGVVGPHGDLWFATPGYLATMQIPLLRGRWFNNDDRSGHPKIAVVDSLLARTYWPGQNPVGQHVRDDPSSPWMEIVGVVGHVRRSSLEADDNAGVIYQPMAQNAANEAAFLVRTEASPDLMRAALIDAVQSSDGSEVIYGIRTLQSLVNGSLAARRLLVWLLTLFGTLALILVAIGIYGLLSFSASKRTIEIGIRMALGAQRWQVVFMIMRQSFAMIVVGMAAGLAFAFAAQRVLVQSFAAMNTGILGSSFVGTFCIALVAIAAGAIPANRSAKVDPAIALRAE